METYLVGRGVSLWFANQVPGKPEVEFTAALPVGVAVMGTLRLGLPHRDVDLFALGERVEEGTFPCLIPLTGIAHMGWLEVTGRTGIVYRLQKLGAVSAEGRFVTLTANPPTWFVDQDGEYARARALLEDPGVRAEYLRLRAEGKKDLAYRLIGVRYAEERA